MGVGLSYGKQATCFNLTYYEGLLEIAKTAVERAIQTDDATTTTWINEQPEALGVELT
ncbi:MAG: hypothetical protein HC865_25790 [Cyanobacteria bacterium RU_5_0]|nr:hypothetical protein [Cyanobacteria bacterium RU_5_0]